MTSKAIACPGSEGAEAKRLVGYVAVDGIAARSRQAVTIRTSTASTEGTYLEAVQLPPRIIKHQRSEPRSPHWHHFRSIHLSLPIRRKGHASETLLEAQVS